MEKVKDFTPLSISQHNNKKCHRTCIMTVIGETHCCIFLGIFESQRTCAMPEHGPEISRPSDPQGLNLRFVDPVVLRAWIWTQLSSGLEPETYRLKGQPFEQSGLTLTTKYKDIREYMNIPVPSSDVTGIAVWLANRINFGNTFTIWLKCKIQCLFQQILKLSYNL